LHDSLDQEFEEKKMGLPHHHHFHLDCAFCRGTGVHPSTMKDINHQLCPVCHGRGELEVHLDQDNCKPCLRCGSSGEEPDAAPLKPCCACGGRGIV
jgi:DnaJ-class molecular chaperone